MKKLLNIKQLLFLLICTSLICPACLAQKRMSAGCYVAKDDNSLVYLHLKMNRDSSYEFINRGDMYKTEQKGKWQIKHSNLVLRSFIQPTTKGYFTSSAMHSNNQAIFTLFDIYHQPLNLQNHVYIKQKSGYLSLVLKKDNIYTINKDSLKNIFALGIGSDYQEVHIQTTNPANKSFYVYLVPDTKKFYQQNERYKIINDSTLMRNKLLFRKTTCTN